jgi:hypothetical protein
MKIVESYILIKGSGRQELLKVHKTERISTTEWDQNGYPVVNHYYFIESPLGLSIISHSDVRELWENTEKYLE